MTKWKCGNDKDDKSKDEGEHLNDEDEDFDVEGEDLDDKDADKGNL